MDTHFSQIARPRPILSLGRLSLGRLALGRLALGRLALGRLALDMVPGCSGLCGC